MRRSSPQDVDFLVVSQYFPPERGAAQVRLQAVCRRLVAEGRSVEVLTALPNYPTGRILPGWGRRPVRVDDEDGFRVIRVWVWAAMGSGPGRLLNYLSFGLMTALGLRRARRPRWTVIEYPTLFGAVLPVLWARAHGSRVVLLVADLWVDVLIESGAVPGRLPRAALRRIERWVLCQADAVTVVTEGVGEAVKAKGVDPSRLCWLPNGVDTDLFRPPDDEAVVATADGPATVLYAGTHGHVHGLDVVLDAAALLADRPMRFLMVGGGSEKPALEARARAMGLDNVEFRDPVPPEEVADLLAGSRIGLASVRGEEIYRSVRSAKVFPVMAAGVPVVYSGHDEGAALVVAAGAGLATPPGDGAALAAAIGALLDDPERAAAMGRAGRRWVEGNAGWDRLVARWLEALNRLGGYSTAEPGARGTVVAGTGDEPVLGFLGIHAGRRSDQAVSQNETLAALFEGTGVPVRRSSAVRRPALRSAHQLVSMLRWRRQVDLVIIAVFSGPSFWIAHVGSWLSRRNGSRTVLFLHGGALGEFGASHRRRVRAAFDRADLILAPSTFLAEQFRSWGYDVRCIPNVLAVDRYEHRHREEARPRLLWMRTFHENYHPEMAVDVLARVVEHHPDAVMTMAGADRGLLAPVRERAEAAGVLERISFPGYMDLEAKRRAFADHDLFLNTNRVDNMPVSVLEAGASGLVPVATEVGGIPHLLTDGVDSLLVPEGDVEAMAAAVLGLLADPEHYSALGRGARALAERSSWPSVHQRWREELGPLLPEANIP